MELVRSNEFMVHRVVLARMAAEAYVRLFWWFVLPGPLFGIILLAVSREPLIQAIGAFGCIWPATIPFRAYLITWKLGRRLYAKQTVLTAVDEGLLFDAEDNHFRIAYAGLRSAYVRHGMVVMNTKRYQVLLVPTSAFSGDDGSLFLRVLSEHGVGVNQKSFLEL